MGKEKGERRRVIPCDLSLLHSIHHRQYLLVASPSIWSFLSFSLSQERILLCVSLSCFSLFASGVVQETRGREFHFIGKVKPTLCLHHSLNLLLFFYYLLQLQLLHACIFPFLSLTTHSQLNAFSGWCFGKF